MINFATLHYRSADWIDLQLDYIARHTTEAYRVWACLDQIPADYSDRFHYSEDKGAGIAEEYDYLAGLICEDEEAADDDWIVFLHGDTIPIADWVGEVREAMERDGTEMVGIRRDENLGEPHPHACFTVCTVGLWRRLGTTWKSGPKWEGSNGKQVTDLGAQLWRALEDGGVPWSPLLRSNEKDLHPLWFGIYGGIVYHHGAGFRLPISRIDSEPSERLIRPLQLLLRYRIARWNQFRSRLYYRKLTTGREFFRELQ